MASFSVVTNISASNAQANLGVSNSGLQKAINRLSSGLRINSAGDDAAGLSVANTYRSEQAVLTQGIRNANDGLSTLQIKDGAISNISSGSETMPASNTSVTNGVHCQMSAMITDINAVSGDDVHSNGPMPSTPWSR